MSTNCKDEAYYQAYLTHHHISRRGLFRGVLGATEVPQEKQIRKVHRPPFSAREDLFLTVCNGCGECKISCFVSAISLILSKN